MSYPVLLNLIVWNSYGGKVKIVTESAQNDSARYRSKKYFKKLDVRNMLGLNVNIGNK